MEIENEGRVLDIGLYRHWVDPWYPLPLRSSPWLAWPLHPPPCGWTDDDDENWRVAQNISGLSHLTADITQEKSPHRLTTQPHQNICYQRC